VLRSTSGSGFCLQILEDNDEFITAKTDHRILLAARPTQALGHFL
jgi:hypothetical protein